MYGVQQRRRVHEKEIAHALPASLLLLSPLLLLLLLSGLLLLLLLLSEKVQKGL